MTRLSALSLEGLRRCVRPELASMPAGVLEQIVESAVSGLPHNIAEDFTKALGSVGKKVGSTLQRSAPGMAQGAATGASVGGPWGALIGAGAGMASSALSTRKPAQPTTAAAAMTLQPSATGTMPAIAALPTGHAAAATLSWLLNNRTVRDLLMSQVLRESGRQRALTASGASLPRGAINNLLMQLLANATEALPESESTSDQTYLQDEDGEYLIDPASPEQQAALVLSQLQSAEAASFQGDSDESLETVEWITEASDYSEEWPESEQSAEMAPFY